MTGVRNCPCRGCDKRTINCHGTCEGYKEWRKELDDKNETVRKNKEERELLYSVRGNRKDKNVQR